VLLVSVEAPSYDDGLWQVNNLAALFSMHNSPYGPESVEIQGEFWRFDPKTGFQVDESPEA
jgi:hypothetical protein